MSLPADFHNVSFPAELALGMEGGPERKTHITTLESGAEVRISPWRDSRRRYNAGFAIRSLRHLSRITDFFEERRGRLFGFRLRDRLDNSTARFGNPPQETDQTLIPLPGNPDIFPLRKRYGGHVHPWDRPILLPELSSLQVAIAEHPLQEGADFSWDDGMAAIRLSSPDRIRANTTVTAGFHFDVPVRFDTDHLDIDLIAFEAGSIPNIPLIEIHLQST